LIGDAMKLLSALSHRASGWMLAVLLSGCGSLAPSSSTGLLAMQQSISPADKVALLPLANLSDVPQAGLRAEALLESALRQAGLLQLQLYPATMNPETLFEPSERRAQQEAEKWARQQGVRYAISGAVNEWRYKVGVDGEPAVGLVLQIKDLGTDQVVYSAAGGRTGWSREALSAVAQKLTAQLIAGIRIERSSATPAGR
jgi:TolB-like protein